MQTHNESDLAYIEFPSPQAGVDAGVQALTSAQKFEAKTFDPSKNKKRTRLGPSKTLPIGNI
jgi:hypothetical protein